MTHPKVKHPLIDDVQRDFCFLLNAYDVEPGASTPKPNTMLDFNDVAVGQMRQLEFLADEEGDWAFHCHKSYHTMNPMGHTVPNMIGVEHRGAAGQNPAGGPGVHGHGRARHGRHVQHAQGAKKP